MGRLLLVEDEEVIGRSLEQALAVNGHDVEWQRTGSGALTAADHSDYDLVLLDLGLPDLDGVDLCRDLRGRLPDTVLVILTARDDEIDAVVGLEAGADDYLTKPFRLLELLARIRAHLRRRSSQSTRETAVVTVGDLRIDLGSRRCWLADSDLPLRAKEYDLLARLAVSAGQAVSREALMSDVWDANWFGSTKTLDVHIAALRRRIEDASHGREPPPRTPTITTLRGFGYRLDDPDEAGDHPPSQQ